MLVEERVDYFEFGDLKLLTSDVCPVPVRWILKSANVPNGCSVFAGSSLKMWGEGPKSFGFKGR